MENKSLKETEIIHLETSIERHPTNDLASKLPTIDEQKKNRIDILINDKDITLGDGEFYIPGDEKIYFSISERLHEIFNQIFNLYSELGIDEFKESIDIRVEELPDELSGKEFLKQKLYDEFILFDDLKRMQGFEGVIRIEDLKNYWFNLIENDHLFNLICCLKFDICQSEKITEDLLGVIHFGLFENFFISDNLKLAYEGMRLEKRIFFLKDKLNKLDWTIKTEVVETSIPEKIEPIQKAAIAMLIFYRGIKRVEDEHCIEDILKETKLPANKNLIKNINILCNKFWNEESILETKGNKNAITTRKKQIESIIPFLKDYPTGLSNAKSNMLTLSEQLQSKAKK